MDNPYSNILISNAKQLVEKCEASKQISHNPTKGALREVYLRSFLRELMPKDCNVSGGFVTDSLGSMTPQLDLIGFDDKLPSIELDQGINLVPIETTRFWMEVKSVLKVGHLDAILDRLCSIDQMKWSILRGNNPAHFQPGLLPSAFIVAYETDIAVDTLKQWVTSHRNLVSIVIVGKSRYWNLTEEISKTEYFKSNGKFDETLFLAAKLHQIFGLMGRSLEDARQTIASLSKNPTADELAKAQGLKKSLDTTHYGLQSYLESVS